MTHEISPPNMRRNIASERQTITRRTMLAATAAAAATPVLAEECRFGPPPQGRIDFADRCPDTGTIGVACGRPV
jgi:hypothetical protein